MKLSQQTKRKLAKQKFAKDSNDELLISKEINRLNKNILTIQEKIVNSKLTQVETDSEFIKKQKKIQQIEIEMDKSIFFYFPDKYTLGLLYHL